MFRRAGGNFYSRDKVTGQSETMAKAYLSAKSPDLLTRTWADVMEHYSASGVESTRDKKIRAFRRRPFAALRRRRRWKRQRWLLETKHGKCSGSTSSSGLFQRAADKAKTCRTRFEPSAIP